MKIQRIAFRNLTIDHSIQSRVEINMDGKPADYQAFLAHKTNLPPGAGFEPIEIPEFLFPFQRHLVDWAIRQGRAAIFAQMGLGKTPMQLVWADNIVRHTGKPAIIVTPLYRLCPACNGTGQYDSQKAKNLGFDSLPCPHCSQRWVVPVEADPLIGAEP